MSVPALRFKEFIDEWGVKKLGELSKVYDGTHMTPDYEESGVPFYSVEHLTNNDFFNTKFISEDVFEKENKRVTLEKGDILMTRIGDIGTPKYISWDVRASFYVSLALIKNQRKINSLYLSHFISSPYFQKELHQRTIHVAFPKKINLGEISECFVKSPCESEQTKIANFLTAVDEKISILTQKADLLSQYKKGVMQQIFSQELRFKDDDGQEFPEWEEKRICDIADLTSSKRVYLSDYVSEGIPFYRGKEISELKRNETPKDILYITTKAYNAFKASYGVPQVDDILITAVGTLGNVYRIKDDSEFYFKDGNLIWLRDIKILSAFLEILFETNNEAIQKSSIGSSQRALTIVELKKLKFSVPSLPEQTKIANFLTAIDEKITNNQTQLDAVKQYKQGLLQQMFV